MNKADAIALAEAASVVGRIAKGERDGLGSP